MKFGSVDTPELVDLLYLKITQTQNEYLKVQKKTPKLLNQIFM